MKFAKNRPETCPVDQQSQDVHRGDDSDFPVGAERAALGHPRDRTI